jgi:TolB protein
MPAWSPSHSSIAVASADGTGGALSTISSSGSRAQITDGGARQDSGASWSPDGRKLVFARYESAQTPYSSIWVIDRDGTSARRIAVTDCFNRDPSWSSDGTHIAFWSSRDHCGNNGQAKTGEFELYVMNSDGSNVRRLGTAPNSGAPAFSPDGGTIAFSSDRNGATAGTEIYTIKIDGTGEKRLTSSAGDDTDPTWSPDGTHIAFRSARGNGGIYTMKADGSEPRFVVSGSEPGWS